MARLLPGRSESPADFGRLADEDLIELASRSRPDAFELVYDRHADAAYSLAYRMCGDRSAAEDVVQESFLAIWRSGARYDRSRGSVRTWVLGIVHHRAVDSLRRHTVHERRRVGDDEVAERLPAPQQTEVQALHSEQAREVHGLLRALPAEQVQVLELAYFAGFTHREIARMLDLPEGTVKGRMRLGLQKLRSRLGDAEALEIHS